MEREICQSRREAALQSAKVTECVRKIWKSGCLWILKMTTDYKRCSGKRVRLKAKEIYRHVTQGQKNVKLSSASALHISKGDKI